jgi:hypothetical protein
MIRSVLLTLLSALPAMAQVESNPGTYTRGGLPFRPYINTSTYRGNYLPSQIQYVYPSPTSYYAPATAGYAANGATSYSRPPLVYRSTGAASFRYYPNYPSLNTPRSGFGAGYATSVPKQPLPLTAPPPIENSCDPYLDDDGCLIETAGW